MKKRNWLSRGHRLRVAGLAIQWLKDEKVDAHRFACACVVIERYLVDGGEKSAKLHAEALEKVCEIVPMKGQS